MLPSTTESTLQYWRQQHFIITAHVARPSSSSFSLQSYKDCQATLFQQLLCIVWFLPQIFQINTDKDEFQIYQGLHMNFLHFSRHCSFDISKNSLQGLQPGHLGNLHLSKPTDERPGIHNHALNYYSLHNCNIYHPYNTLSCETAYQSLLYRVSNVQTRLTYKQ